MIILGINALGHDAAVTVLDGRRIVFAAHAERYSRIKNDDRLNHALLADALNGIRPDIIAWYERPWLKKLRQLRAGQWHEMRNQSPAQHLREFGLDTVPCRYFGHHHSHAAAGYYTSRFEEACVVVVDAIGEFDCMSIWRGRGDTLQRLWASSYPHSMGLLYSAMTQRCGLKPNEEEYILMGMAAYGEPVHVERIKRDFLKNSDVFLRLRRNVHRGIRDWRPDLADVENLAASMQVVTEDYLLGVMRFARAVTGCKNLVFMGGVALNCVANARIARSGLFDAIWIMPNPGDAGSSLGAAALVAKQHVDWRSPYLGHDIARPIDIAAAVDRLVAGDIVGLAHGRAEFGPRALGNRSLLADPRHPETRDRVNAIKRRQKFRPFAPLIMGPHADRYFDLPVATTPYMQFVAPCKMPEQFPAICHVDGTSRVQTLRRDENEIVYSLLEAFYERTGCPMLLNTSANIKHEPLINTWDDALRFSDKYSVPVF